MIQVEKGWDDFLLEMRRKQGRKLIYVLGAMDSGKTTLCRFLLQNSPPDAPAAYIDCDPGQSNVGPPTTIGARYFPRAGSDGFSTALSFIGSISPQGHLLQCVCGTRKLVDRALAREIETIIVDSSGYVQDKAAREFQFQVIDLLRPDYLVALERGDELERLLQNFVGNGAMGVVRLSVSKSAVARTARQRQFYRLERFRSYFRGADLHTIDVSRMGMHGMIPGNDGIPPLDGLLVALCDGENFVVTLGIVSSCDSDLKVIQVFAPPFESSAVRSVQFGSLHLAVHALGRE